MKTRNPVMQSLAACAAVFILLIAALANAAEFNCAGGDTVCLINSIKTANGNGEHDTINLMAGTYTLTAADNDTDAPNGLPSITSQININGAGVDSTTIERDEAAPRFRILHVSAPGFVTLNDITVKGGDVPGRGGGIYIAGAANVTLINSAVRDNVAEFDGGGLFNFGTLDIRNSNVSGNMAFGGGGMRNEGHLTVINSSVSNNVNSAPSGVNEGGGIVNGNYGTAVLNGVTVNGNRGSRAGGIENRGPMTVVDSTIVNNMAIEGAGGGIFNWADLAIINSTISGNVAEGPGFADPAGGGIKTMGTLTVVNSTITANEAMEAGGIANSAPGLGNPAVVDLINTIVAGNSANDQAVSDCRDAFPNGVIISLGHNLVGEGTGCPSDGVGDITVNPNHIFTTVLGSLQNNGGPTDTHALMPGSPAIDAGQPVCTDADGAPVATDQRGKPRPVDGNGDGTAVCDIGAFESQVGVLIVDIDIKPHSTTNRIRLDSDIYIWVAVMSSTTAVFDPLQIDVSTVRFGHGGAQPQRYHVKDLNGDGLGDLVMRFDTGATGISCSDTNASLSGVTYFGESVSGTDMVAPRNCSPGPGPGPGQREVSIDIKPHSSTNKVYPGSDTKLYVAVISDAASLFEPNRLVVLSVRFGPRYAKAVAFHTKDFNGDGIADLVLRFSNLTTGIACGDTEATLTGTTLSGEKITGSDFVSTQGC